MGHYPFNLVMTKLNLGLIWLNSCAEIDGMAETETNVNVLYDLFKYINYLTVIECQLISTFL